MKVRLGGSVGALAVGGGICGVATGPVERRIPVGDGAGEDMPGSSGRPVEAPAKDEDRTRPRTANPSTAMNRMIAA